MLINFYPPSPKRERSSERRGEFVRIGNAYRFDLKKRLKRGGGGEKRKIIPQREKIYMCNVIVCRGNIRFWTGLRDFANGSGIERETQLIVINAAEQMRGTVTIDQVGRVR